VKGYLTVTASNVLNGDVNGMISQTWVILLLTRTTPVQNVNYPSKKASVGLITHF